MSSSKTVDTHVSSSFKLALAFDTLYFDSTLYKQIIDTL